MLFNSVEFILFFALFYVLYRLAGFLGLRAQNLLILVASYVFYGSWDYRFLSLIIISSAVDYTIGLAMGKTEQKGRRKALLAISLLVNLGMLATFKYLNFFIESFQDFAALGGWTVNASSLQIILPVGISFYTFQTLSYTIDIYRGRIEPTRDVLKFFSYVAFFPQLVAGPIERAMHLLPQFSTKRKITLQGTVHGLQMILFGFFKKVVVADNCAFFANQIFEGSGELSGSVLFIGAVFFAFQIYGDFSGYSDIAIGTSRLLGFELSTNFRYPYFSRDIAEFWRRWHISLSSWFRDYLYIPLGGSMGTRAQAIRNIFIIFIVSGFWHGANWTFIFWGFLNAVYFLPIYLSGNHKKYHSAEGRMKLQARAIVAMGTTFFFTCIAWVFFRAEGMSHAWSYLGRMASDPLASPFQYFGMLEFGKFDFMLTLGFIALMLIVEWLGKQEDNTLYGLSWPALPKYALYLLMSILVLEYFQSMQEFIYFQF